MAATANVVNSGIVANKRSGLGVDLSGGQLTNNARATISGYYGLRTTGTVVNAGYVVGNTAGG